MPLQSNLWFAAVDPASVPTPNPGYYALFISNGAGNTIAGFVHKKASNGEITTAVNSPDDYTDEMARDAVASILQDSDTVGFLYDDVGNFISASVLASSIQNMHLANNSVGTGQITDAAVTADKILDGSVTSAKIDDGAVTTMKFADSSITNVKIADGSVTNTKLDSGAVTNSKLADNAVDNTKLADLAVTNSKLAPFAVNTGNLADGAVTAMKLAANSVNASHIMDGTVIAADVADGAVTTAKLNDGSVTTIKHADASVTTAKIADANVTNAKLAANAVGTTNIVDGSVTNAKLAANSVNAANIVDGTVGTAELVDGNVTNAKLASMAQATFKMRAAGAGTGVPIDGTAAQAKTALAITASDVSGLGTAATQAATAFDAAGAAAAAQAASQPLDADLTAIAALSTTAYGRGLLTLANATANTALLDAATQSLKGLMSSADKVKLDNLGSGSGVYSVINFGISTANSAAANLTAWNTLMSTVPDNATVSFPPGPNAYQFSGTLTIPSGKHLRVTGSSNQKSIIQTTSATADIFSVGDWYNEFNGLKFTSSVTRTAGAAITSGNNVAINVYNCDFDGMWDGIVYTGGVNSGNLAVVSNCGFTGTLNRGIVLDGTNANTIIEKVVMDGTLGVQQVGLELLQCGSVLVSNCDLIRSVNNLRFNPSSPNGVFSAYFINTFFDTSSASSVRFQGTGNVQRVKFTNCWFSGSVTGCEFASTAATLPTAIDFVSCDIFGNSSRGIYANGVQDFSVTNCRIAGNTTAGIETVASAGAATKFNIANNSICPTAGFGANGTGILINSGTYGGYAVKNNDLRSNTTSNLTDSGTVATTDLKIINDNFGHMITGSIGNLATTASSSSTSASPLLSVRVPAKAASAGQVFRMRVQGNSSSTGTVTFRVYAGSNGNTTDTQVWVSTTSGAQTANQRAGFDGTLTVRSAGAAGTVQCECLGFAGASLLPTAIASVATPTVNTTNPWFITLAVTCSVGTFTAQQAVVEAL